jgi:tripartite-type tricarboxylate transporter receptor subunit TctC
VEFVVPAGTGGGADQMARFIQGVVAKNNLMKQPIIVVNKAGGAGAEGFLDVKGARAKRTRSSSRCRTCTPRRSPPACRSTGAT